MMEGAYFVGRVALLQWINELTGLGLTKIEQTASGVVACHVFDALYPNTLRLDKVNFSATREYEFVQNYKVLQGAFARIGISKEIFVDRLIRGKYQDNLEFMQWVKGYFDLHASDEASLYDGAAVRASVGQLCKTTQKRAPPRSTASSRARATVVAKGTRAPPPPARAKRVSPTAAGGRKATLASSRTRKVVPVPPVEDMVPKSEVDALKRDIADMDQLLREGDTEREFYFRKLQNIEGILQDLEDQYKGVQLDDLLVDVVRLVKQVLYENEDDNPAVAAQDELLAGETGDAELVGDDVQDGAYPADQVLLPDQRHQLDEGQNVANE